MRIVHTTLRYPPATGGAEQYVENIVKRTRNIEEKRDVRVLSSAMKTHGPISMLEPELMLDDPIYLQRLRVSKTPYISYPRLQALSYYIGHHAPDILESYGFWYQPADVSARYAKKHAIPFIFHPIYYENSVRRKPVWQLYKHTIGKATFRAADAVVVLSEFEKKLIEQANMPVKRFEIVPPGVDIKQHEKMGENPFAARNISGTILLTVSRIARSKGIQDIIAALPDVKKSTPDIRLAIAGEDFGYRASLKKRARELGVLEDVHFLGKLSDEELLGAYRHAAAFVHASHYEAFGIVLIEAMASGIPIIARDGSAIPYVMPNNQAGLLFRTHDDLVQSIIAVCANKQLAQRFGEFGKTHVLQNFTWDASIKKLLALYEELGK